MTDNILEIRNLKVNFKTGEKNLPAVDDVSFDIKKGEVFALVGESGCGKSTTAMGITRLVKSPGEICGGEIIFNGQDLLKLSNDEMAGVRGKEIGMIFQNPLDSLNPVYSVGAQMTEGLVIDKMDKASAWKVAEDMLKNVNISDAQDRMTSFPHEISGGMRQRVMIGMMLCRNPKLLIADEPTTALDVTIQAGIIELMNDIREQYNSSILMITHDFGIVADIADRVGVMYAGSLIELGDVYTIFDNATHPYTRSLLKALPTITKEEGRLKVIKGSVPDLSQEFLGCKFYDRCDDAVERCKEHRPSLELIGDGHYCACFLAKGDNV